MDPNQTQALLDLSVVPVPRADDVASPEAAVRAIYDVISGPAETERGRDWDRFRSLFLPGARFVLPRWQGEEHADEEVVRAWDVEGFIEAASGFYRDEAFFERELWCRTERFGRIAHVTSAYEARAGSEDSEPVMRGVNGVHLVWQGGRWWVAGLVWDLERPDNPLPEE